MKRDIFQYQFEESAPPYEIEGTLMLAILAGESLHSEADVRLGFRHSFDANKRACAIDAGSDVGQDISKIFTGFCIKEFGAKAFRVSRMEQKPEEEDA